MIDPHLLHGRRIHAILSLAGKPLEQRAVTGVGSWDGTQLLLVPDGRQSPLSIPLSDGRVPAHELTTDVWAALLRLDAETAETGRAALGVPASLPFCPSSTFPAWAAQ